LSLRRATEADARAVRALTQLAYAKWVAVIGREPLPMTADYERAARDHIIDLHEENGELLALIEMVPGESHLLIENLAVRPMNQGKGLGEALLTHAEDLARSLGLGEVRLYTNAAFGDNLRFYGRHGYAEYRRGSMVAGSITVFMRKVLGG
jgi:GNAT superfamily N-acetyltransferase